MKKIGIVTINYNNLEGLKKTFESLKNQTIQDFFYVVVDGESTDGSAQYIFEKKKKIDKFLIEKDRGIYDALNKGVELCDAEYILALNSGDTLINENVLERVQNSIKSLKGPVGVLYGKAVYVLDDKKIGWTWPSVEGKIDKDRWIKNYNPNHQAAFINKKVYEEFKYNIYYKIFGDGDFWYRLKKEGINFKYIDLKVAYFELGGISNASENIKTVIKTARESLMLDYFYSKKTGFIKIYIIKLFKFSFKFLLRKILGKEKFYGYLRDKNIKDQNKIICFKGSNKDV